jgi:PAS domain S-box-containing protein
MSERRRRAPFDPVRSGRQRVHVDVAPAQDAEQALHENHQRYEALFGQMLEGVAYCRMLFDEAGQPADWIYLEVNPAFETLTGLRGAAGKRVTQLIPGVRETNPELFEIYGRVAETGVPEQFETYLPDLERWFSVKAYRPQRGDFAAVFENITEQRHAAEELRAANERIRQLFDANVMGIVIAGSDGAIFEANDYFLDLIGHTRDELERGEINWRAITPPEWLPVSDDAIGEIQAAGTSRPYEKEYLRADGIRVPVLIVVTGLSGPDELIAAFVLDLTEHRRQDQERDSLAAVVEQSPDGIVITDPDHRIVYANAAFATGMGREPSDLVGRSMFDVVAPVMETVVADFIRMAGIGHPASREIDRRNPDGTLRRIEATVTPIVNANGDISGWVGILRDVTELRQAQAAEAASEARLRTAIDTMLDGVTVLSAVRDEGGRVVDFRIDYSNPALDRIGRMAAGEQIGHTLLELFPAYCANGVFEAYVRVVETGVPYESTDFHHRDPDAEGGPLEKILERRVAKMGDGLVISMRDVTAVERARRERERLAAVVEESPDGMVITDPDFRITYANAAYATSVGRAPSELVGRGAAEMAAIGLDQTALADLVRTVTAGRPWFREVDHRDPDGSVHRNQDSVRPTYDANGDISSWVGVFRDVTELRSGEAERARLSTAIEQSADAVVITDADGRIEYVNPAFERVSGYTRDEVLGQNPRILKSGVHGPAFYAAMWAALTSGHSFTADMTNRRKDGSLFEDETVISPVLGADGTTTSYVEVARDVTRQRAREAVWERQARERALISGALGDLEVQPTPTATAEAICRQVVSLAGLATATLLYFSLDGPAMPLGFVRADGVSVPLRRLPFRRSEHLREQAVVGPWVEPWIHRPWHPYEHLFEEMGVQANAFAPVRHGGQLIGLLIVSSAAANATSQLTESLPALLEFATIAGALVGPAIVDLTEVGSVRHRILKTIGEGLYHPVFQPIVDLASRETVGYEALTRFDSGQRPDLCFADAWSVDTGPELELATLGAAVAAARRLPAGLWLSLNVSPRLLVDPDRLNAVLWPSDRPIVLEITEHAVIEDYGAVLAAIRAIGHDVRLAVDDAGAGVANFGHIIELRPNIVKLDISLVRDVNTDLGRQAMVVGMRHFAAEAGCRLLAEGVETGAEADTVLALGVDLGQGYFFGHPERVEAWAVAEKAGEPRD